MKTLPEVRKARLPYIDRSREMAWIAEHEEEHANTGDDLPYFNAD